MEIYEGNKFIEVFAYDGGKYCFDLSCINDFTFSERSDFYGFTVFSHFIKYVCLDF